MRPRATLWTRKIALVVATLVLVACSTGSGASPTTGTAGAPSSSATTAVSPAASIGGTLRIETFGGDQEKKFLAEVLEPWANQNGVEVVAGTFGQGFELLAAIKAAPGQYDLLLGFGETEVYQGGQQGILEEIGPDSVPNWQNIDDSFAAPLGDQQARFAVPYWVDTYTFLYDKTHITNPDSYSVLWDPANNGRIGLRDYGQYRVYQTAKYLGFDPNNLSPEQVDQSFAKLTEQCALVKTYWKNLSEIQTLLVNGEVWVADVWGIENIGVGDLANIDYFYPKEGGPFWLGSVSIAKGSPNRDTAEAFLNYMLTPEVYAKSASIFGAPTEKADLWDPAQIFAGKPLQEKKATWIRDNGVLPDPQKFALNEQDWNERYQAMKLGCG